MMAHCASLCMGGGARLRRSLRSKNGKGGFLSWEWGRFFIFWFERGAQFGVR
jgi:hypothetical protein